MKSYAEQLRELGEARRRGDINDAEFDVFKADLLRQANSGSVGSKGMAAADSPALSEPAAQQVGAYRLLSEIGRGGMGVVYKARHQLDSQVAKQGGEVALKLMHGAYAQDATYRARFEREADVGLRLEHPGIVRVHDLVVDAGQLALVMELVEGRTLTARLAEQPRWSESLDRFHGVLDAMRYSHEQGVLHRDLKPANIMVPRPGAWKVADFGLARAEDASTALSLTASQGKLGTAAYMAPEQAEDARKADARSDVYALGLILWEILTGRAAWEAASSAEQLHRLKWQDRLVDLAALPAGVPRALAEVAWKASRAAPGERQGSVAALQTELRLAQAKVAREQALLSSVGVGKAEQARPKPMPAPPPRPDLLDSVELPGPKSADEGARRERFEPAPKPAPAPAPAPAPSPKPAPRPVLPTSAAEEEARRREDARRAAEDARRIEAADRAEDAARKKAIARQVAEEARRRAEEAKRAEEKREAEEARRRSEEAKRAEEKRKAMDGESRSEKVKNPAWGASTWVKVSSLLVSAVLLLTSSSYIELRPSNWSGGFWFTVFEGAAYLLLLGGAIGVPASLTFGAMDWVISREPLHGGRKWPFIVAVTLTSGLLTAASTTIWFLNGPGLDAFHWLSPGLQEWLSLTSATLAMMSALVFFPSMKAILED